MLRFVVNSLRKLKSCATAQGDVFVSDSFSTSNFASRGLSYNRKTIFISSAIETFFIHVRFKHIFRSRSFSSYFIPSHIKFEFRLITS